MLIQNVNSAAVPPQPARPSSDGGSRVADTSGSVPASTQQPSTQQLQGAVDSINTAFRQANKSLELSIDMATNRPVVRMMDSSTGELISQYPSKEVLAIAQGIDQFLNQQGLLLNKKA